MSRTPVDYGASSNEDDAEIVFASNIDEEEVVFEPPVEEEFDQLDHIALGNSTFNVATDPDVQRELAADRRHAATERARILRENYIDPNGGPVLIRQIGESRTRLVSVRQAIIEKQRGYLESHRQLVHSRLVIDPNGGPVELRFPNDAEILLVGASRAIHLQDVDGIEIIRQYQKVPEIKKPPIIHDHIAQSDEKECCICFSNKICRVLRPCGHAAYCFECTKKISECSICKAPIKSVEKFYY